MLLLNYYKWYDIDFKDYYQAVAYLHLMSPYMSSEIKDNF